MWKLIKDKLKLHLKKSLAHVINVDFVIDS